MARFLVGGALTVLALLASIFGYRVLEADIAAAVYRDRLASLGRDYDTLVAQYNDAVKRTAVTELLVANGELSVVIRSRDGVEKTIPTRLDPDAEIYVDYVVLDGRLWIRRVFDSYTPPSSGVVIDPQVESVDWSDPRLTFGKAVYRALTDGRWVVTVSGDGSLGLAKAPEGAQREPLADRPAVRDFEKIQREAQEEVEGIGVAEVWERLVGG